MLVGHFAVAFIGKRIEPGLSLGTLALASMLADMLWPVFSIAGIEYVAGKPEGAGYNPSDIAFSHSLVMVAVWAALFAGAYFLIAHFHTGGNPGRNELDDTQELNWRTIAKAIADLNFQGYVAHEFVPKRDPLTSLREAALLIDV